MGSLPVEDWRRLTDLIAASDDETAAALPVDPDSILAVFHNGAGDYLCLDLSGPVAGGLIWWHDDPARLEAVDFWAVLDAWTGIFLEDAAPA